jgi:tRNA wybutosine-synthesizing protein 4
MSFERILILKQAQQVLSLGAGYDSMFFRLANMGILTKQSGLKYFEVDYTKSVLGKVSRISKSPLLKSVFSDGVKTIDQDCFSYDSGFLTLVGCNMTHLSDLEAKLRSCHFDPNLPTVILTECSTTYIEAEDCIDLMSWLTDFIRDFVFIGYEQIRPFDAFGRIMVKHFKNRNSAIKCVHHYPTVEDHIRRFKCFGWTSVEVTTIGDIWKRHIDSEAVNLINCEHFDEAAELMLKCSHYVLITAQWGSIRLNLKCQPFL